MTASIFISYKRNHAASDELVASIKQSLSADFELLLDQVMQPGKRWTYELYDWLLKCRAAIIIVSKEANEADWCRREWAVLTARWEVAGLLVIPIHVEEEIIETNILDGIQAWKYSDETIAKLMAQLGELPEGELSSEDFLATHQAWIRWQYKESQLFGREPYREPY